MLEDTQKADKIALAKKKLKEYESRKNADNNQSSNVSSVEDGRNSVLSTSSAVSSEVVKTGLEDEKTVSKFEGNGSVHILSEPKLSEAADPSLASFKNERESFITERNNLVTSYNSLKSQLQELHTHYSQLHSAYSQLTSQGSHIASEKQVIQLQKVIAVMVEEKTDLNKDLRKYKEELEALQLEFAKTSNEKTEPVVINLPNSSNDNSKLLDAAQVELDNQRKITAEAQARLLAVQHERSEAQSRVKLLFREKEELESQLVKTRKDLQMKEIYLKQLSSHQSPIVENAHVDEAEIKQLHDRVSSLEGLVQELTSEKETVCQDLELSRKNYEKYCSELSEKATRTESDLEMAEQAKFALEMRVTELQTQLNLFVQDMEELRAKNEATMLMTENPEPTNKTAQINKEEIQKQVSAVEEKISRKFESKMLGMEEAHRRDLSEKDSLIMELRNMVTDAQIRNKDLEERFKECVPDDTEMLSLSEQLQNEKATVSRAVAQNKELKQLLLDTEDRLVALTEEKLQCELGRQSAEHMVKELTRKLDETGSNVGKNVPSAQKSEIEKEENSNESSGFDDFRERELELRNELEKAQRDLSEMRSELRRSINQNQEMNQIMMLNAEDENQNSFHVELGQAVGRINILSSENDQLRETISNLTQKLLIPDDPHSNPLRQENERMKEELKVLNEMLLSRGKVDDQSKREQHLPNNEEVSIDEQRVLRENNEHLQREFARISEALSSADERSLAMATEIERLKQCIDDNQNELRQLRRVATLEPAELHSQNAVSELGIEAVETVAQLNQDVMPNQEEMEERKSSNVVGSEEWAKVELEKKFSQAMRMNAELQENMERVEHINVQLQLENDTIADHVILYQHQRRLIRERLRAKDLQLASLETERQRVIERCQELQEALVNVLNKNSTLKEEPVTENIVAKVKRKSSRTFSHSTVDELSGDEEVVVPLESNQEVKLIETEDLEKQNGTEIEIEKLAPNESGSEYSDPDIKRIFSIINDINVPLQSRSSEKLQCTQCIGELKHI